MNTFNICCPMSVLCLMLWIPKLCYAQLEPYAAESEESNARISPEQLREALITIFSKIDGDGDRKLNEVELTNWAKRVNVHSIKKNTANRWHEMGLFDGATLPWNKYKEFTFGLDTVFENNQDDQVLINQLTERDQFKWNMADVNGDGLLTFDEFAAFLHPESFDHMHDTVLSATVRDLDIDRDGLVSEMEFIGEVHRSEEGAGGGADEEGWVLEQRRQFREVHDTNKDGVLDAEEIRVWLNPLGYSAASSEAKHVLYSCDVDHDGTLSLAELLDQPEIFARTMLADYGNALHYHDEL